MHVTEHTDFYDRLAFINTWFELTGYVPVAFRVA